jgi:hypothetical protein
MPRLTATPDKPNAGQEQGRGDVTVSGPQDFPPQLSNPGG